MSEDNLPVDTFEEAYPFLRRPFVPAAVRFKVQATGGEGDRAWGLIIAYIDSRNVTARLNTVCPGIWQEKYEQFENGLICHLTVGGITHADWGVTEAQITEMRVKGTYSDALKRAAVRFGVGESLYATPQVRLNAGPHLRTWVKDNKTRAALTGPGEIHCREIYAEWLNRTGIQAFGPPLDHGDGENKSDAHVLADLIRAAQLDEAQTDSIRAWASSDDGLDPVKVLKATHLLLADEADVLLERAAA